MSCWQRLTVDVSHVTMERTIFLSGRWFFSITWCHQRWKQFSGDAYKFDGDFWLWEQHWGDLNLKQSLNFADILKPDTSKHQCGILCLIWIDLSMSLMERTISEGDSYTWVKLSYYLVHVIVKSTSVAFSPPRNDVAPKSERHPTLDFNAYFLFPSWLVDSISVFFAIVFLHSPKSWVGSFGSWSAKSDGSWSETWIELLACCMVHYCRPIWGWNMKRASLFFTPSTALVLDCCLGGHSGATFERAPNGLVYLSP